MINSEINQVREYPGGLEQERYLPLQALTHPAITKRNGNYLISNSVDLRNSRGGYMCPWNSLVWACANVRDAIAGRLRWIYGQIP